MKDLNTASEEEQLRTVKKEAYSIGCIDNPSELVQLAAVKKTGLSIEYIVNPTEKVQFEAVKQNPRSIQYIVNPSEELQIEAIVQGLDISYIPKPSKFVVRLAKYSTRIRELGRKQALEYFKYHVNQINDIDVF